MYLLLAICFTTGLAFLFYLNRIKRINSATIKVKAPNSNNGKIIPRKAVNQNLYNNTLIEKEAELRRIAYEDTIIKKKDDFYTDEDLKDDYFLIIVYHRKTFTPLLSARYFYETNKIQYYLEGDDNYNKNTCISANELENSEHLFIDRMSGNRKIKLYKKNWKKIHLLFYSELIKNNKNKQLVGMGRVENGEKLFNKYTYLGLKPVDEIIHNGIPHYIFIGNLSTCLKEAQFKFKYTLKYIMAFQIKKTR